MTRQQTLPFDCQQETAGFTSFSPCRDTLEVKKRRVPAALMRA
jgi:hypothetical protein